MVKVGINGFGRIGRSVFKVIEQRREEGVDIKVVAINDPALSPEYMSYLLKYDSIYRKTQYETKWMENTLIVNSNNIKITKLQNPEEIDWSDTDVVVESTGFFTTLDNASKHFKGNAKKVIISAPSKDVPMFVMGVNHTQYNGENVISNSSCTTNCLSPIVKVLEDNFGIIEGLMSTIHSSTSTQQVIDGHSSKNWRLGRSALTNIIPSSTGAAEAVGKIIPQIDGKLSGISFRVPTSNVSVVDLTVKLKNPVSFEKLINTFKNASDNELKGILGFTNELLVSSDIIENKLSSIIDINASLSLNNTFVKIVSWYDNEWGYSNRLVDLLLYTI